MNDEIDDAIALLLFDSAPGPVADEGFCVGVIDSLPPRRGRIRWPLALGVVAGMALCWFSLRSAKIVLAGWAGWLSGDLTSSTLVLIGAVPLLGLLALAWTIAEAQEPAI